MASAIEKGKALPRIFRFWRSHFVPCSYAVLLKRKVSQSALSIL